MNVLFTDNDGVLNGYHFNKTQIGKVDSVIFDERKLPILKSICDETKASVVLSSSIRLQWGAYQREPENKKIRELLDAFKRHGIPFYGRLPVIGKKLSESTYFDTWKEYEIKAFLECHHEVEHFCVLDDDLSDLEEYEEYAVKPNYYTPTGENEGLMPYHIDEIKRILKKKYWK